jgi:hypothetical protein
MEVLLIDMGALAMFLAYMAIVYRHGVSREAQPRGDRSIDVSRARSTPESL